MSTPFGCRCSGLGGGRKGSGLVSGEAFGSEVCGSSLGTVKPDSGFGGSLLQEIQSLLINWKGPDLTTYGELVLEATFRVHRVRNERTFFLFDKILLITKKRGDHFVYKGHIPVTGLSSSCCLLSFPAHPGSSPSL